MVERTPSRVNGLRLQQGAHLTEGQPEVSVGPTVDQGRSGVGRIEPHDHAHRRGLAGSVGAQEPGDRPGLDAEREVVHRHRLLVPLGQPFDLDHGISFVVEPCAAGRIRLACSEPW